MIRKLNENEINRVMKIWKEATIKAHDFIPEKYWIENYSIVKEEYIPKSETYVYLEESDIKGFISVINGEYIGALFIDVSCQGKGIGRKLIDYVRNIYNKLSLSVYKDNENAVNFYKKIGFQVKCEKIDKQTHKFEYIMVDKIL
ncbi:putative acetyltransferase [Clostridium tetanomorphum]|uniref:N-acetyltransferase n=1 Tax=Clostridium tetanomorphum TaxID=1553 RepID=A0A923EBA2_CLOTT|nr:N-acetyltransferase [Clostridium tetanomorphum]KAJ53036.1 N-acetyltransferase GCN5 [Clostridium tetanomorphum DSM 665]MBC2398569.1 N-acetyltransferase [Clostridium tetanomorphum]MBP1864979.1 putative acetyltransferase [Clostridium tetanomorphum]NRS83185.1 putative acetyltransferase [Clostridium tetanomorphum]NRZ98714.1 putative acetyltransferase [Clostridium tetanomorphum]